MLVVLRPHNADATGLRVPVFIDRQGRACAVGQLMIDSGAERLANHIAADERLEYLGTIETDGVGEWVAASGLTFAELARIQPAYCNCEEALQISRTMTSTRSSAAPRWATCGRGPPVSARGAVRRPRDAVSVRSRGRSPARGSDRPQGASAWVYATGSDRGTVCTAGPADDRDPQCRRRLRARILRRDRGGTPGHRRARTVRWAFSLRRSPPMNLGRSESPRRRTERRVWWTTRSPRTRDEPGLDPADLVVG